MNEDVDFGNILVVAIYKKPDPLPPTLSSVKNCIYCNHGEP